MAGRQGLGKEWEEVRPKGAGSHGHTGGFVQVNTICQESPEEGWLGQEGLAQKSWIWSQHKPDGQPGPRVWMYRRVMPLPSQLLNIVSIASTREGLVKDSQTEKGTWAFQGELIQRSSEKKEMEMHREDEARGMEGPDDERPSLAGKEVCTPSCRP